jgi:hypothetical protein
MEHYNEARLQDILATRGCAYDLNFAVSRSLQTAVTRWPRFPQFIASQLRFAGVQERFPSCHAY